MPVIIESIVEEHAMEVALLWPVRDAATALPSYDLKRLGQLDERIEAHLDGLRIAGDTGWEIVDAAVDDEAGEVFGATVLAVERRDVQGLADILDIGGEPPELARGLVAGLGWAPLPNVKEILPGLLDPRCPPSLHYLGIAACAAHRVDPGEALARALFSEDDRLARRALEATGELGRADLRRDIGQRFGSESADVRFGAAWSAALLGDGSAVPVLRELATSGGRDAAAAFTLAVRRADRTVAAGWIRELAGSPETSRVAIMGAGALGDSALVPWLLSLMGVPLLARVAGEALTFITGIEIGEELAGEAPPGFQSGPTDDPGDDDIAADPDEHLTWPKADALQACWEERHAEFAPHTRRLLGCPITPASLREILRGGNQRQRAAAALELAILSPGQSLFEVRAPAFRQLRALGS
ncbi:TIGR02270 family protein [Sorangium sp. So ce388]|uniref:TIGR02270 family protein n=1 Tax=Sorangium sp. So ce388 TaxID=3133309 RepID=UPI003F5C6E7A